MASNKYGAPINIRDEDLRSDDASLKELIEETKRLAKRKAAPTNADLRKAQAQLTRKWLAQRLFDEG